MCTTCVSSLVPLSGGSLGGLLTLGAVAGSAALGSLTGLVGRGSAEAPPGEPSPGGATEVAAEPATARNHR